jgi:transposase
MATSWHMFPACQKIENFIIASEHDSQDRHIKTVYLNAVPVCRFNADENSERRLAAIELVELGLCTQSLAGEICGFHRNTVAELVKTKDLLGLEAAIREERGRKAPLKYITKIQEHILKLLEAYPDWTDQAVANLASKELEMDISRNAVARIRVKGDPPAPKNLSKQELLDMARIAVEMSKAHCAQQQLKLPFEKDPELRQKQEELAQTPPPQPESKADEQCIEKLQEGVRIPFAGGFMHHLFLQEIGFDDLLSCFPALPRAMYQPTDILGTIFHGINLGLSSIESMKLINAEDLGFLIGRPRAPEKETLRDHLTALANLEQSSRVTDDLARRLLDRHCIDKEVFFIDGHFLPYYGMHVLAKGYYTVRRMAMKGNYLYAVTDLQGRPLFFLTESCEIDFRPMIARSVEMLVDFGIQRPIMVFDRGGYGVHFFTELNKTADFVTWSKYVSDEKLQDIKDELFTCCLVHEDKQLSIAEQTRTISESATTASKDGRDELATMTVRMVVMRDQKTGDNVAIFTNNWTKPAYDIAFYMCQRWGKSENFFKESLAWFNLDYHPGYDLKELKEQPLVDNPDIALVKKGIKALEGDVKELQIQIDLARYKLTQRKDKRIDAKIDRLEQEKAEKQTEVQRFQDKLAQLPDKISILERLKGKPMKRCDLEKKKLYDLMQCLAFHSRERLVDIFRDCYHDNRDIKQVLGMITRTSGLLKLTGDTLVVILDWIDNLKHRKAADKLCHKLNELGVRLSGRLNLKLAFYLNKINRSGEFVPLEPA